jgi:hypothetical protein
MFFVILVQRSRHLTWYYVKEDLNLYLLLGRVMAQAVMCRPVTSEFWVRTQATKREICGGVQSGTATDICGGVQSGTATDICGGVQSGTATDIYGSVQSGTATDISQSISVFPVTPLRLYSHSCIYSRRCI